MDDASELNMKTGRGMVSRGIHKPGDLRRMVVLWFVIFYGFLGVPLDAMASENEIAPKEPGEIKWRSERLCGVNCLFIMLGVYKIDVDYELLSGELLPGDEFTSLTKLKESATRHGLEVGMGRSDPAGLQELTKPVLAHWEAASASGNQTEAPGHYVLVLKTTPDGVEYMDGTTGVIREVSWREFQRRWSGYLIWSSGPTPGWSFGWCSIAILGGMAIAGIWHYRTKRKARISLTASGSTMEMNK